MINISHAFANRIGASALIICPIIDKEYLDVLIGPHYLLDPRQRQEIFLEELFFWGL
jgi:hypothetical protein